MPGSDNSDSAQEKDDHKNVSRKSSHPTYLDMLLNSIHEENSRNGVSRAKIVQHIKSKYKLEDVSAPALRRAVQVAEQKGLIENKTGVGMNGKFSLTSKQKLEFKKIKKQKESADTASTKEKTEPKIKPKPKVRKEDKGDVKAKTKRTADGQDKTTTAPKDKTTAAPKDKTTAAPKDKTKAAPKGKENKPKWKKGDPIRKPQLLQAKVALTKAKIKSNLSKSAMDDPGPSSKQQNPGKRETNILL